MKWKKAVIPVIMALLMVFLFAGCIDPIEASGSKAVGGGWIYSVAGQENKAIFGFTVMVTAAEPINEGEYVFTAKGQIQLRDQGTKDNFHANIWGTYLYGENTSVCVFTGKTRDGLDVAVMVSGNDVMFQVTDGDGNVVYENSGAIMGGNVKVE